MKTKKILVKLQKIFRMIDRKQVRSWVKEEEKHSSYKH